MRNKFFAGNYGWDKLSKFLFVAGAVLFISRFTSIIGVLMMLYAIIRTFSKDCQRREREEAAFENWLSNINYRLEKLKFKYKAWNYKLKERRQYVIIKCPNCSQKLRLPRHKGKIVVTCKRCLTEFRTKS